MLLESACIPVPSELIMTFGGALAAGAVPGTGAQPGRRDHRRRGRERGRQLPRLGRGPVRRPGRAAAVGPPAAGAASTNSTGPTQWFDRYGPQAVLIGRLLPVVRTFISLPAGIAGMDPVRFGIYTTIGCIPWTAALAYAGYAVGANWHSIVDGFRGPTYIIAALVVIALAIAAWRYLRVSRVRP